MYVFISHSGREVEGPSLLARALRAEGIDVWLDRESLMPGDEWLPEVERAITKAGACIVYVGREGIRDWVDREVRLALTRSVRDDAFRIIPVLAPGVGVNALPPFLSQLHAVELGATPGHGVSALLRTLRTERALVAPAVSAECPFRGLHRFEAEQAHLFFGRDRDVEALLALVSANSVVSVLGASGCGKSSLIRAGLIPALLRGRFAHGYADWRVALIQPAADPLSALAAGLNGLAHEAPDGATEREPWPREDAHLAGVSVRKLIEQSVPKGVRTLIVIDQFEELFTVVENPEERQRFLDPIFSVVTRDGDHPIHVVVGMRADLYAECWSIPNLPRRLSRAQYTVEAMSDASLREVIERPLELAGGCLEAGLTDTILSELGREPGNLPLLEFLLDQLWELRRDGTLHHLAYQQLGRVSGAIAAKAERVYATLEREGLADRARSVMLGLVRSGDVHTKRPLVVAPRDVSGPVIERLVEARLLVSSQAGPGPDADAIVEVAHEALIRHWDRLRGWADDRQEWLRRRDQLESAARSWAGAERSRELLLRGGALRTGRRAVLGGGEDVSAEARELVRASLRAQRGNVLRLCASGVAAVALVLFCLRWVAVGLSPYDWMRVVLYPPEMVEVPAGSFVMGSPESEAGREPHEGPTRRVTIPSGFEIGKFEVTHRQYAVFAKATGRPLPTKPTPSADSPPNAWKGWPRPDHPVVNISWYDAKAYAQWLSLATFSSYRLPTEAEWEYAARAGTTTPFSIGATASFESVNHDARFPYGDSPPGGYRGTTVPVGTLQPNPWGLYEMHGNANEWVEDDYIDQYVFSRVDGTAFVSFPRRPYRVIRGGGWHSPAARVRSAVRGWSGPLNRFAHVGLRLAR